MKTCVYLDIEEYNRLKELADLNQSKIDKMKNRLKEENCYNITKQLKRITWENEKQIDDLSQVYKSFTTRLITKVKEKSIFGYVKSKIIIDLIKDFMGEENETNN